MQAAALRRHYLPHEAETTETLAAALWLHRHHQEQMTHAVHDGIAKAFNGT